MLKNIRAIGFFEGGVDSEIKIAILISSEEESFTMYPENETKSCML